MTTLIAGRYDLEREIGRGGMGAVWLARDVVLDREVALKRVGLLPGSDSADVERVAREARVSAMLNHEHVVAVYDLVTDGQDHWLVMEHVRSRDLGAIIKERGALSPDETADLVGQAAGAVAAAHRAGIVHRDIKPSNMLVTGTGRLKLGDFGIARAHNDPTLTQTGMVTGSPAYLAPEVASGAPATPASDVWSLGATVFHAVAGNPPYDAGDNLIGALYRLVHEDPPLTDKAGWLEPLLLSTMHPDPAGRWTAQQVADFLTGGPSGSSSPPVPTLVTPPPSAFGPDHPTVVSSVVPSGTTSTASLPTSARRKVPTTVLLAGLVLILALVGFGGWWSTQGDDNSSGNTTTSGGPASPTPKPKPKPEPEPKPEPQPESSAPPEAPTAEAMTKFVTTYLDTVTKDPATTWKMLTPSFQRASGSFAAYRNFWGPVTKAKVSDVVADPSTLAITYHVEYTRNGPGIRSDDVRLRLAYSDGDYLIDDEGF